ncbi:hypothetical protein AMTR_s00002p00068120 [Amborella trichopoda]|uniref:Uncharacterized protein n=1 Tax=Amborella trichopoda TaxID=13333 RepID=W1P1X4_AMBTC|nr:hypothetical protein AMTR_s00002p00068120 [Amborella trichopoda]
MPRPIPNPVLDSQPSRQVDLTRLIVLDQLAPANRLNPIIKMSQRNENHELILGKELGDHLKDAFGIQVSQTDHGRALGFRGHFGPYLGLLWALVWDTIEDTHRAGDIPA